MLCKRWTWRPYKKLADYIIESTRTGALTLSPIRTIAGSSPLVMIDYEEAGDVLVVASSLLAMSESIGVL